MTMLRERLIEMARAARRHDAEIMARRPAGCPRAAWRMENPGPKMALLAREGRATRSISLDYGSGMSEAWVWSATQRPRLVDRVDLSAADADERLARYVPVEG